MMHLPLYNTVDHLCAQLMAHLSPPTEKTKDFGQHVTCLQEVSVADLPLSSLSATQPVHCYLLKTQTYQQVHFDRFCHQTYQHTSDEVDVADTPDQHKCLDGECQAAEAGNYDHEAADY